MTATPDAPSPTDSPAGIVVSDACSRFRPTPETTSAWYAALDWCRLRGEGHDPHHAALANLAEKLERERDEARERLAVIACDVAAIKDQWLEWQPDGIRMVIANVRRQSNPSENVPAVAPATLDSALPKDVMAG